MKILAAQPKLKSFTATEKLQYSTGHQISLPFVETLKAFGKSLTYFRCEFHNYDFEITESFLREVFKEQFKIIEFRTEMECLQKYAWLMKNNAVKSDVTAVMFSRVP